MSAVDFQFTFNLFDLIELILLISGAIALYYKADKRILLLEVRQATFDNELNRIDTTVAQKLSSIEQKLDTLAENVAKLKGAAGK